MYEPSDEEEKVHDEEEINLDHMENRSEDSKEEDFPQKLKNDLTPLEDTSVKMSGSEAPTEVDPCEKRKIYNPEEPKYPLEYNKYLKVRETIIENLIKRKVNCFGNFGISLFWEEKILIFIRYLQLYSMVYVAFYEYWPYDYVTYLGDYIVSMGFNFIYIQKGFYTFIQDFNTFVENIWGWLIVWIILIIIGVTIIRVKRFRHEFKHSKTLLKKWVLNIVEILYLPLLFNLIPMLVCDYTTIKNGYELHKCSSYGSKYYFYLLAIVLIIVGVLYNVGLIYMISKRKISYRQKDHDAFMKRKELEYILEISDSWRKQSFFLFSSYKGSKLRVYFKPLYNMYILFLIWVHAFTEGNAGTKASIYSGTFTVAFIFIIRNLKKFFNPWCEDWFLNNFFVLTILTVNCKKTFNYIKNNIFLFVI